MRQIADQVESLARLLAGGDGAVGPLRVVLVECVTTKVDPLLNLAGEPLEAVSIEVSCRVRRESQLRPGGFGDCEEAFPHVEDTQIPWLAWFMQGRVVCDERVAPLFKTAVQSGVVV